MSLLKRHGTTCQPAEMMGASHEACIDVIAGADAKWPGIKAKLAGN